MIVKRMGIFSEKPLTKPEKEDIITKYKKHRGKIWMNFGFAAESPR